jgi:NAD-reducing hydrogenase small subunit
VDPVTAAGEQLPAHRLRVATVWLAGCSGCHMSLLDMDERLLDLAGVMDLVYSPLMDVKEFPEQVDIVLVEGAVANEEQLRQIQIVRDRSAVLVAFGDCAVTGNVTALRNPLGGPLPVLRRAYLDPPVVSPVLPAEPGVLPALLDRVLTLRACVRVDYYLPGCPPTADVIHDVLAELVAGRTLHLHDRARLG